MHAWRDIILLVVLVVVVFSRRRVLVFVGAAYPISISNTHITTRHVLLIFSC